MMHASHLSKRYGDHVVFRDADFRLVEGKVNALVGPSGSGKTTLLRLFAGLESPDAGNLDDFRGLRISMVFQEDRLCRNLSASANVRLVADQEKAEAILTALGLGADLRKPVRFLSGGMQRRVALARALAAPYDLLLLDEPFTGLDAETKDEVIAVVRRMTRGSTVVLVTHERKEIAALGEANLLSLSGM